MICLQCDSEDCVGILLAYISQLSTWLVVGYNIKYTHNITQRDSSLNV